MWPRLTCFIVMLGPILGSEGDARAEIRSELRERSYLVSGKSAMEVAAYMRRRPFRGDYGPAIANIRPRYTYTFKTEQKENHCRAVRFKLKIDFTMTLPKARQETMFDPGTRSAWRSLRGFTRRHELVHRKIYLGCAKRLERAVLSLRPRTCGGIGWKIRKLLHEEKKACKARHLAFDRRELRRLTYHRFFELARRQREQQRASNTRRNAPRQGVAQNGRLLFFVTD